MKELVRITAGSEFGRTTGVYKVVSGRLVFLRSEGNENNLPQNGLACLFDGYTIEQAQAIIEELNSIKWHPHYDGCHLCRWGIQMKTIPLERELSGNFLTRGDYGVRADKAYRIAWDAEANGWRKATEKDDYTQTQWGVFDPDWGWLPYDEPAPYDE